MLESKRREKILASIKKMKKSELIEYIMDNVDMNAESGAKYMKLLAELSSAEYEIERLEEELRQVKKNDRGAGRKEKFDDEQIEQILKARREGKSMRTIAKEFNCSAGLVHKLIKNREEEM